MPNVNFYRKRITQVMNNAVSLMTKEDSEQLIDELIDILKEYKKNLEKSK
jgi:hypothetical protein